VVLEFGEGEAVLGVAVAFGDDAVDLPALFEHFAELLLEFLDLHLGGWGRTLPSRLVMNSLVVSRFGSEADRCRCRYRLEWLDSDNIE
jgi:hypothetical protein